MNKNYSEDMSNLTTYYTSALMKIQIDTHSNLLNLIGQQKKLILQKPIKTINIQRKPKIIGEVAVIGM